jgi:hypothetical protein
VDVLPEPSVAVTVTVLTPSWSQVNKLLESEIVGTLQASDLLATTLVSVRVAWPAAFMLMVAGLQMTLGGVWSLTVTVNEHVAVFAQSSVAVQVTVVEPKLNDEPL